MNAASRLLFTVSAAAMIALAGCAGPSEFAQKMASMSAASFPVTRTTVGALLDKGAKRLSAGEVKALFGNDVTVEGAATNGARFRTMNRADGKFSGEALLQDGRMVGISGTWSVDDAGRACSVTQVASGTRAVCQHYYLVDKAYFVSESTDRSAAALERRISR